MPEHHAKAHIITHTHWDREWFLTSVYTSQWIAGLVDKLVELVQANPAFQFLLDGQTLVIEDLLATAPHYEDVVRDLVQKQHLIIGPYYCQPDWQLTTSEALIRNLRYGHADVRRFGTEPMRTGWLVDTFGHIAQSPQLHRLFGIDAVFVWRGVPELMPYFDWIGSNGQSLLTIDLFGGYRNLYGITHAPEIAVTRLEAEIAKLRPYYPTPDIPLFDGYDLEDNPEDPVRFFEQVTETILPHIAFQAATPQTFADTVRREVERVPALASELNSGKYGATFPGTFSARTYLKIMACDCDRLLYQLCEPLAVLARIKGRAYHAEQYETWGRALLQNAVHDCICGVSIDQVHEKMEVIYRQVFDGATADIDASLAAILHDGAPGTYAVSTNAFPYDGWIAAGEQCYHAHTDGIGVWPVEETHPVDTPNTPVSAFEWHNEHYSARLNAVGSVQIGEATLGRLVCHSENGDTYSDEAGLARGVCQIVAAPVIEQRSAAHSVVRYACRLAWDAVTITALVRLTFDQGPLVRWQIELDSHGTDFQVDLVFETAQRGTIMAGMPFDMVQRPAADRDLLPRQVDPTLAKVLLGQRELNEVRTFPFHDMVTITDGAAGAAVFARGLHSYRATDEGQIAITLRRAVEWLTKADLDNRVGDAGPFFYVPDARCERQVQHELAVVVGTIAADAQALQRLNAGFQNPPLIVDAASPSERTTWAFMREDLPLSSLHLHGEQIHARIFNPTAQPVALHQPYQQVDVWGQPRGLTDSVAPKDIVTVAVAQPLPAVNDPPAHPVQVLNRPRWRVGANHGAPDRVILAQLAAQISDLEQQIDALTAQLEQAQGRERYLLEHRTYVLKRELYEYRLSVRLNALKLNAGGELSADYLFTPDAEVADIGFQLNQLRIKRRIYDYIIESV